MKSSVRLAVASVLALAASAAVVAFPGSPARAVSGATGNLVRGGSATGDISLDAGDEDRVTIDLVAGATLTAKFASTFAADVRFIAPGGAEVDLGWGTGAKRTAKAFTVAATGRHEFRIKAASGQGTWSLAAAAKYPKKVALSGTTGGAVTWSMPSGASVSGKVAAFPAKSWDPVIDGVSSPGGSNLLPAPVQGSKGLAVLPKVTAGQDGPCEMTVSGGSAGGAFRAALTLVVPKSALSKLALANGLTKISYEADGVKALLTTRCAACHTWTVSAATVKPHAKQSLARVVSGNMPQGGPQLPAADVALLRQWIDTGMNP